MLNFSNFSKIPKYLPLGSKPGFYNNCLSLQAHCLNDYSFLLQTKSLFDPAFSCQNWIIFSFLESLWHQEMHMFYKEVIANYLHTKEIFTFLAFLKFPSDYLNVATFFTYFKWHGHCSRAFKRVCFIIRSNMVCST